MDTLTLILLDMMLPGFSGDEIITKIRAFIDIPIIVISAGMGYRLRKL